MNQKNQKCAPCAPCEPKPERPTMQDIWNDFKKQRTAVLSSIAAIAVGFSVLAASDFQPQNLFTIAQDTATPAVETTTPAPVPEPKTEPAPAPIEPAPQPAEPVPTVPSEEAKPMPIEEKEEPECMMDPREVKNAQRDITRMQKELKRFVTQLKKLKLPNIEDDLRQITDLQEQLKTYAANIKNPPADTEVCEVVRDFWDARMWEEVDKIRMKVELPRQLKDLARDLKRIENMLKIKSFQTLGFDMEKLNANVAEIRSIYDSSQAGFQAGNLEEAWEALQPIHEGKHPGEIQGVLYQTRDIVQRFRPFTRKNEVVKEKLQEILQPVIDAVNEGDFREARMALEEIFQELMKLVNKLPKYLRGPEEKMIEMFDKIDEMMQGKMEKMEQEMQKKMPVEEAPKS